VHVTFTVPAGEHTRFQHGCFDAQLGKQVTMRVPNRSQPCDVTLLAVSYAMDGLSVEVTVDVPRSVVMTDVVPGKLNTGEPVL